MILAGEYHDWDLEPHEGQTALLCNFPLGQMPFIFFFAMATPARAHLKIPTFVGGRPYQRWTERRLAESSNGPHIALGRAGWVFPQFKPSGPSSFQFGDGRIGEWCDA